MFIVTSQDQVALTLTTVGQFDGFRGVNSPVASDAVEAATARMYGEPLSLGAGRIVFAEDN